MTVSSQQSEVPYAGDGVTTVFPIPFYFLQNSDIQIVVNDALGNLYPPVQNVDYTVTGAGNQAGGTATFSIAPVNGRTVTIQRIVPATQLTDYQPNDDFPAETHERALDKLTMLVQQTIAGLGRALVRPIGKNYYDAEGRLIKNLGDGAFDTDAANMRVLRNYVDSMIAGVVGGFGYFIQSGLGAIARTFQAKMRDAISTKDFGAVCDGVNDDTEATKNAIAEAYARGGWEVFVPGLSVISESLVVPRGVTIRSTGRGYEKRPVGGFLFRGTGAKLYSIPGATAISVANPDVGAAYLADSGTRGDAYSTLDLTAAFSAAVILDKACQLRDLAVIPWFDGVAGYLGSDTRLSDEWDVGVWCRNASGWKTQNVIVDGHWRKSALLVTSSPIGDGLVPECELGEASYCSFGGFRGVSIRAPRNANGASNYGFAGTDFINCFIRSLNHQNLCLATSSTLAVPFPSPSACLEMDGSTVLRGVQFTNCTFMGRDDICVISDFSSETLFQGCYEESKAIRVSGVFQDDFIGSRMVATANTAAFFWHGNTKYAVDFSPYFTKDSSLTTSRYDPAKNGAFSPVTAQDSEWERPNFATSFGTRLRQNQVYRIYDYLFTSKFSVTQTGAVSASDNITIAQNDAGLYSTTNPMVRRFASGTVQLANGVASLSDGTMTNPGIVRATTDNTFSSGSASFRWSTVFAGTGTINTSDERHKSSIQEIPDDVLDALAGVKMAMYQMDDAIELKGDSARWHFGVVAQRVKACFEARGLDPFAYGLLCHDEWVDVFEPVIEEVVTVDEEGVKSISHRETGESRLVKKAGDRYGIRYEELLCLRQAYLEREIQRMSDRIGKLEVQ